jgi:hypothetical protein
MVIGFTYRAISLIRNDFVVCKFLRISRLIIIFGESFDINCLNLLGVITTGICSRCG